MRLPLLLPQFSDKEPFAFRPPVGEWSPQNGLGSPETRFTDRKYEKGATEGGPPLFRMTKGQDVRCFIKFHRCFCCLLPLARCLQRRLSLGLPPSLPSLPLLPQSTR